MQGLDRGRRFCVFGFCRSIEMLNDVVEDTVLDLGGEVFSLCLVRQPYVLDCASR